MNLIPETYDNSDSITVAGCPLPLHFRTVSAVSAQTCLNCYENQRMRNN